MQSFRCAALVLGTIAGTAMAGGGIGPDVIVGDLPNTSNWGASNGIRAYSVGTTSCNIGDENLDWFSNGTRHPVIGQNMYRLMDGRFEQIGLSWLKHGFFALQGSLCEPCTGSGSGSQLGVGCSDPYSSGLNGSQGGLGPRSEVNASTGEYIWPYGSGVGSGTTFKRLQVRQSDLALPGATYYVEGHYVALDDATAGNDNNNASWRRVNVSGTNFNLSMVSSTRREEPAIFAWQEADAGVMLESVDVPDDGRFWVGSRAYDNGDGTWDYEYAVHNLNSHQSGGGFNVPAEGATVTNIGFSDVDHHSGEPYDGTDWTAIEGGGAVSWSTDPFDASDTANALRWGTLYNYRFTADSPPSEGEVEIDLYRPGTVGAVSVVAIVPTAAACIADWNDDGLTDFFDVQGFLNAFDANDPSADLNDDGMFDFFDVQEFLNAFQTGCA